MLFRSGVQASAGMETRVLRSLTSREADTPLLLWPKAGPSGSLGSGASQPVARFHVRKPPSVSGGSVGSSPRAVAKRSGGHRRWPGPPHGLLGPVLRAASRAAHPRSRTRLPSVRSHTRDSPPSPSGQPWPCVVGVPRSPGLLGLRALARLPARLPVLPSPPAGGSAQTPLRDPRPGGPLCASFPAREGDRCLLMRRLAVCFLKFYLLIFRRRESE